MNKLLQVICYVVSLALLLWLGSLFWFVVIAEPYSLREYLPGKPLPGVTLFVLHNPCAIAYALPIPWLLWIGWPLAPFVRIPFWDETAFLMRFAAFLIVELALVGFVAVACYWPYVGIIGMMSEDGPKLTGVEYVVMTGFWLTLVSVVLAFLWRFSGLGKKRNKLS